jgi:hypothetical protein
MIEEKEYELAKRQLKLEQDEERLFRLNHLNHKLRYEDIKAKYEVELDTLRNEVKEKTRENKRLADSFKLLKQSNEALKQQVTYFK